MEAIKYAKLCLDERTRMFVIHIASIGQHKMSLKMKTAKHRGKIQKLSRKMQKESVEAI